MKNKAIIFTKKDTAELIENEVTEPGKNQVQIKLAVSTLSSGTERANLTGEVNITTGKNPDIPVFPRTSGYSSSGTVAALGEGITDLKVGDRVALSWSTHSQYINMNRSDVYKIADDSISFEEAALWHIGTFSLAAIRKCRLEIGESALVMGQGVIGCFAIMQLRLAGAAPIIAVDPVKEKREQALKLGADYAFDPFDADFTENVKAVTNGGVKVGIEVTGNGKALDQILDVMRPMGRVALLGCTRHSDFTIDYYHKVHGPGITLVGAHTRARPACESSAGWFTQRDDVLTMRNLCKYGRINFADLVAETHSPTEAPEIYSRLAEGGPFPLIQFDWRRL